MDYSGTGMINRLNATTLLCLMLLCPPILSGCNLIYKQNIQQGNALEQEDLDQLELGMSKNQVAFLLGTPAIRDPFHQDRWDYISTFSRRGGEPVRRLVTLRFENDTLVEKVGAGEFEGEEVLGEDGAVAVSPSTPRVGVRVEDARDYEDLSLVPDDFDHWELQFGSFSLRAEADARLEQLQAAGVEATIYGQVIGEIGFFIIRGGRYATREEAERARQSIADRTGLNVFLVSPGS
jgi:outer membrane protein assembly factor BamE